MKKGKEKKQEIQKKGSFKAFMLIVALLICVVIGIVINDNSTRNENVEVLQLDIINSLNTDSPYVCYSIEYEEGMTWEEWIESEYNKFEFTIAENEETFEEYVICFDVGYDGIRDYKCSLKGYRGNVVSPSEIIDNSITYTLV